MKRNEIIPTNEVYESLSTFENIQSMDQRVRHFLDTYDGPMKKNVKKVLLYLAQKSLTFFGVSWWRQKVIAKLLGVSVKTIQRALLILEDLGVIKVYVQFRNNKSQTNNCVVILPIEEDESNDHSAQTVHPPKSKLSTLESTIFKSFNLLSSKQEIDIYIASAELKESEKELQELLRLREYGSDQAKQLYYDIQDSTVYCEQIKKAAYVLSLRMADYSPVRCKQVISYINKRILFDGADIKNIASVFVEGIKKNVASVVSRSIVQNELPY